MSDEGVERVRDAAGRLLPGGQPVSHTARAFGKTRAKGRVAEHT